MSVAPPARIRLVENITDEIIDEAVAVALRAFTWDAVSRSMTGNNPALRDAIYRMQFGAARIAGAMYVVTPHDSDKILATGLWFGPGTNMMDSPEQRAAGYDQFMEALDPVTRDWWLKDYGDAIKIAEEMYGKDVIRSSWYANLIATDPEHQGKGYGSMLVRAGFRRGVEDKTVVALATPSQPLVGWYKSLGFERVGTVVIRGPDAGERVEFTATWLRCDDPQYHL